MNRTFSACLAFILLAVPLAEAQTRKPLLIDGKTELFQRILTRPGAMIAQGVGAPGEKALDPFTPLYVYQRHPVDGGGQTYLEVGPDAKGTVSGFLPEPETVPWRHSLVLAFSERVNRGRTLFFREEAALRELLKSKDRSARATAALAEIDAGKAPADGPVIAVEPETPVDFETKFYMLPILSAEQTRVDRKRVRIVEVASITADEADPEPTLSRRINPGALKNFRAGVVFVIDASSSMGPYIDRTRAVMRDVLAKVEAEGLRDKVRFGLVAYRDDPDAVSGIEYLTRTFADPNAIATGGEFDQAIQPLSASTVSTRAFAEDSFAAIDSAFKDIEWDGFGARYVILITDASSRAARAENVDGKVIPPSDTGLSVAGMNQVVRRNNAALYALHLKSPAGTKDHARAEAQYRALAQYEGQSLYYPVPSGDPTVFADTVGRLADALVAQVRGAEAAVTKPGDTTIPNNGPLTVEDSAALIGRAMALAYLGREQGQEAPPMFRAFATDHDMADPDVRAFTVRVLLSKNQLSDLQKTLDFAVTALENGQIDPDDLFNQLRSAAAAAGRDPNKVGQGSARNMETSGLIGEYLEGLPYQSRLMGLTEDDWIAMGVGDQQAIIDEAYANIRLYQSFHDDSARWIALNEGADPGDYVYPVPLEALP
ncbi:MAG: VWA domain-containing protein [Pikeienuella sp.]